MSQRTIYSCDECQKEIGAKVHISLFTTTSSATGIAMPPTKEVRRWTVESLPKNFIHFCNSQCIARYFGKIMSKMRAIHEKVQKNEKSKINRA